MPSRKWLALLLTLALAGCGSSAERAGYLGDRGLTREDWCAVDFSGLSRDATLEEAELTLGVPAEANVAESGSWEYVLPDGSPARLTWTSFDGPIHKEPAC